ncbi:MAG: oligopeptidase A [Methylococcaceae bacterium]|nr:MAG: oligopeptidase A [Methylococcaceae bacterium]
MNNKLLENTRLPQFSKISSEHIEPAITKLLDDARAIVVSCLASQTSYTWDNLIAPIEAIEDRLNRAWSPVSHLNAVMNNDALRQAYNACLPKLSEYSTEMGQNEALFKAYCGLAESAEFRQLAKAQQRIISNGLRDFTLSGIDLPPAQQQRYKEISLELSALASKFEENVLDATNAWSKHLTHHDALAGLPDSALQQARQAAEQKGLEGWLISLQFPSYSAVMTYADDRILRAEHYTAFATRASDQGPHAGQWDNTALMAKILALRHEKAVLLGYANYAELSLAAKMAHQPSDVISFLENLAEKSRSQAQQDYADLTAFAKKHCAIADLEVWDIAYVSEKMRLHAYDLSQETVKAYFPITQVLPGLFAVVKKLYGLCITEETEFDSWHPDVKFFAIHDQQQHLRGHFFIDLYARQDKRGGAWMDDCVGRRKTSDGVQTPVAYLVCNFTPPTGTEPALLTHDEVTTLFHEFGHGLHHMMTQVDYLGVSGINGVEWDAVELPSQFMENWCWEKEALGLLSGHYQTGEALPDDLFAKMLAAKNFQAGMLMVRQLEFSLFDFKIHLDYDPAKGDCIADTLAQVRQQVSVVHPPKFNRFAHSFSHIFAGGYAAGYYSYKWAEVLSSDAFSLFEEKGIFDPDTGHEFLSHILEQGGSDSAMNLFINFRGREPSIDALLRHNGITA